MAMRFVSLFTGIGGLDLGLERAGMRCAGQVEIDPYCRRVLARHWPRVPRFDDVRSFRRSSVHGRIDLVAGGFPCQDVSNAGKKIGIGGERSGLWSEMLRIIRAVRPAYALVENVSALRARGIDKVLGDLAASGFDAEWDCFPAAAFGAPHLRDRLFIVAYAKRLGWDGAALLQAGHPDQSAAWSSAEDGGLVEIAGRAHRGYPEHLRVDDGTPAPVDRIRGCGNAVVPQVAEWIGRRIAAHHRQASSSSRPASAPSPVKYGARLARGARLSKGRSMRGRTRVSPASNGFARSRLKARAF
jgi:DNA (cytosine-5)-methyltransferase 1